MLFRVWNCSQYLGDILIGNSSLSQRGIPSDPLLTNNRPQFSEVPHLGFMVQALAIDTRSR